MRTVEALTARLGDAAPALPGDPLLHTIEAAAFVLDGTRGQFRHYRLEHAARAGQVLPASATPFERGLLVGLVLAVTTETPALRNELGQALELAENLLTRRPPDRHAAAKVRHQLDRLREVLTRAESQAIEGAADPAGAG